MKTMKSQIGWFLLGAAPGLVIACGALLCGCDSHNHDFGLWGESKDVDTTHLGVKVIQERRCESCGEIDWRTLYENGAW